MELKEFETIDNLNINNLKIIQNENGFKYGTDAVMLSKFANIRKNGKVLDLCTGSGVIPLLLTAFKKPSYIKGVEYFSHISEMAQRSVKLNNLSNKIEILTGDVKKYKEFCEEGIYDNVTVNPPYKIENTGFTNKDDYIKAARHEVLMNLSDCVKAAEYALKFGGKLSMVNRIMSLRLTG